MSLPCCCPADTYIHAQIRCGDLYTGKVVEEFNSCAITKHNCVAARVDVNKYPEPLPESLVKSFDINDFTVRSNCNAWPAGNLHCSDCTPVYYPVPVLLFVSALCIGW